MSKSTCIAANARLLALQIRIEKSGPCIKMLSATLWFQCPLEKIRVEKGLSRRLHPKDPTRDILFANPRWRVVITSFWKVKPRKWLQIKLCSLHRSPVSKAVDCLNHFSFSQREFPWPQSSAFVEVPIAHFQIGLIEEFTLHIFDEKNTYFLKYPWSWAKGDYKEFGVSELFNLSPWNSIQLSTFICTCCKHNCKQFGFSIALHINSKLVAH